MENSIKFVQLSEAKLHALLESASRNAAYSALALAGLPIKEYISRTEIEKKYGRGKARTILPLLTPHRVGGEKSRTKYSVQEINSLII